MDDKHLELVVLDVFVPQHSACRVDGARGGRGVDRHPVRPAWWACDAC
ncbi:hypothetical protein ACFPRL_26180 [Pseudoclavibacter helvolus]